MRTQTLVGLFAAATVGVVVLLFVATGSSRSSNVSLSISQNSVVLVVPPGSNGDDKGTTPTAAAACDKSSGECLPAVQFVDIDGKVYSPSSLQGKVVIVNFWATWCGPCQKEIPSFSRIYDKYKNQGVLFLGIMTDSPDSQTLLNFASDFNLTYPVIRVNADINQAFGAPRALPTTIIFDRNGKRLTRREGALSDDALESILAPLVASK